MFCLRPVLAATLVFALSPLASAQESKPAADGKPLMTRLEFERNDYRQQLARELASREALLKQQEASLAERTRMAKKAQEDLMAEAKRPPPDPDSDEPAPTQKRGEPTPMAKKAKAFERETYLSMVARHEVHATRRDIELLRELLARTALASAS